VTRTTPDPAAVAARPGHAYLVVGPRGARTTGWVRDLAAALIGVADDARGRDLVARGVHPDVVEFEPTTRTYTLPNEVRAPRGSETFRRDRGLPRVLPELHRSPVEGDRKVVVLHDADRMTEEVANALLRSIEEPPPRSVIVLVTASPDELLATVRSRCRRVDVGYELDRRWLQAPVAQAFLAAVADLDGSAARAVEAATRVLSAVSDELAATEERQRREADELAAADERLGVRGAAAARRRLADRHAQEQRRVRHDSFLQGIAALEAAYRDALVGDGAPALVGTPAVSPAAAAGALERCRRVRAALEHQPNLDLWCEWLMLTLPPPAMPAEPGRGDG
jgi:DNA polymerase-3 subunit delta'